MNRYLTLTAIISAAMLGGCGAADEAATDEAAQELQAHELQATDPLAAILSPDVAVPNPYAAEPPKMPDDGCMKIKINPLPGGYLARVFNDSNYVHLDVVQRIGISPINDPADALNASRPLVRVESCDAYYVEDLSMSHPYLIPSAERLLHDIGMAFRDSLRSRGGGDYRIKVTSLLRTQGSVSKLRRRNRNAVEQSAHLYGTTFDISYTRFAYDGHSTAHTQEDLKNLLGEVLYDMRERGRCYVKYERKQGCFHISTRQ